MQRGYECTLSSPDDSITSNEILLLLWHFLPLKNNENNQKFLTGVMNLFEDGFSREPNPKTSFEEYRERYWGLFKKLIAASGERKFGGKILQEVFMKKE